MSEPQVPSRKSVPLRGFDSIRVTLASPEKIRSWSYGEVKLPHTFDHRHFKPEPGGLFCARIFGPLKDFECLCGKYWTGASRGLFCEICGVELTWAKARRERMGHIELACPIAHIAFFKPLRSGVGLLLDMTPGEIRQVLYLEAFMVTDPGSTPLRRGQLLTGAMHREAIEAHGEDFQAKMGAEAVLDLLKAIDLPSERLQLREELRATTSQTRLKHLSRRLRLIESFIHSGNRPEWMVMTVLPVLPPGLRPPESPDGRRALSDLNRLYRRVIKRNNRLRLRLAQPAPDSGLRRAKRRLQQAVDALLDNTHPRLATTGRRRRRLKSLADLLKEALDGLSHPVLAQAAAAAVVAGPQLRVHQCGLPKQMALELLKPQVLERLQQRGGATNIEAARRLAARGGPPVWDSLEQVLREHPVLLHGVPRLSRLALQAFEPRLVEGDAIQLHPLVWPALNVGFDDHRIAVHVPQSLEARREARALMLSSKNILAPANGDLTLVPSQESVLGLHYMTRESAGACGEGMVFCDVHEARRAYECGVASLHASVRVRLTHWVRGDSGRLIERRQMLATTVGRALLSELLPKGMSVELINQDMTRQALAAVLMACHRELGLTQTVAFAERLTDAGCQHATRAGISVAIDDFVIPEQKTELVACADQAVKEIQDHYASGRIINFERIQNTLDIWAKVASNIRQGLDREVLNDGPSQLQPQRSFNSLFLMAGSGACGSAMQLMPLAGMRGLCSKSDGSIIEIPVSSSLREGLDALQCFISTLDARRSRADAAQKAASAAGLARPLVAAAQDCVITEEDCGTTQGLTIVPRLEMGEVIDGLAERVAGRALAEDVLRPGRPEVILIPKGTVLGDRLARRIDEEGVCRVKVRSPLTCEARHGVCALCYGRDLARHRLVSVGEAVGLIAAQSVGEHGAQLRLRTFHIGGYVPRRGALCSTVEVRSTGAIGFHRLKTVQHEKGHWVAVSHSGELAVLDEAGRERERYPVPYGAMIKVMEGDAVTAGQIVASWDPYGHPVVTQIAGFVKLDDFIEGLTVHTYVDEVIGMTCSTVMHDVKQHDGKELRPALRLVNAAGEQMAFASSPIPAVHALPLGSVVHLQDGARVGVGDIIARIPRSMARGCDFTSGLPRLVDLLEARTPEHPAILAEQPGLVTVGRLTRDGTRVILTREDGETCETLIPKERSLAVFTGEAVERGEVIAEGAANPHDIVRIHGVEALAGYLLPEIQSVYRFSGVKIHDKHIEVIIRQMLRQVEVLEPGGTGLLSGERLDRSRALQINDRAQQEGQVGAQLQPVLQGITQAARAQSFISAASLRDAARAFSEAAMQGLKCGLGGMKENIIAGQLIPAGTGFAARRGKS